MKTISTLLFFSVCLGTLNLQAAIISTSETNSSFYFSALSRQISATDLLQTDLDSSSISGFDPFLSYAPSLANGGNLFNGSADGKVSAPESRVEGEAYIDITTETVWSVEFNLNLSSNPLGYDLTEIHSYSGWNNVLPSQDFTIEVSDVGSLDFTSLGRFTYAANNQVHMVSITDDAGGLLASGVDVIRFTHHSNGTNDARGSYRELDVVVIPEPSTAAMVGIVLAVLGIGFCKKFR